MLASPRLYLDIFFQIYGPDLRNINFLLRSWNIKNELKPKYFPLHDPPPLPTLEVGQFKALQFGCMELDLPTPESCPPSWRMCPLSRMSNPPPKYVLISNASIAQLDNVFVDWAIFCQTIHIKLKMLLLKWKSVIFRSGKSLYMTVPTRNPCWRGRIYTFCLLVRIACFVKQ